MNQAEFRSDEALRRKWKETWNEPHMKLGRDILIRAYLPHKDSTPEGGDRVVENALENTRREGYYDYDRFIDALGTRLHIPQELPEPWSKPQRQVDTD